MDGLTFTAEIVKALAWPVAAVVIALVFHRQLKALLGRIRKGSIAGADFEFDQELKELARELDHERAPVVDAGCAENATVDPGDKIDDFGTPRPVPFGVETKSSQDDEASSTAEHSLSSEEMFARVLQPDNPQLQAIIKLMGPRAVVLSQWLAVEREINALAKPFNSGAILVKPNVRKLLTDEQYARYVALRSLRNRVVHDMDAELSLEAALDYSNLASDLLRQLRSSRRSG